jgi:hypothetical protein
VKWTFTLFVVLLAGCGAGDDRAERHPPSGPPPKPQLFGEGPRYHPKPTWSRVRKGLAIKGMRCSRTDTARHKVFIEQFIHGRVVAMPAGIGVSPTGCFYPVRTRAPTGIVEVAGSATLGDFFAVWGRPLPKGAKTFVGSKRFHGRAEDIPLHPHSVITVETGRYVPPHANFVFPP